MDRSSNTFKRLDWGTVLLYAILVGFGWINIYAAVYNEDHSSILDVSQRYGKQLIWISVSVVLIIIIFIIDSRAYEFLAYPIYLAAILLLIAVLLFGKEVNGARSWFEFGSIRFQPAEFTKVATALAIARMMSIHDFKINTLENLMKVGFITILPAAMIILQNDTGSAFVYVAFAIVMYREGLSPWILVLGLLFIGLFVGALVTKMIYVFFGIGTILHLILYIVYRNKKITRISLVSLLIIGIIIFINSISFKFNPVYIFLGTALIVILAFAYPAYVKRMKHYSTIMVVFIFALGFTLSVDYLFNNVLQKHQRTRINVVLGIEDDPKGVGYNVNQSKIAIGSGEFTGKGFLQGTQTKFDFVPEQDTDFIYCTVGEEWGFIGTSMVLILFGALLVRIIMIAERQRSKMNRVYGYAVASILFFHVAVNVGMTIGLTPVIGIPLPFFSYGGSSLWSFTVLLFILLRLDASRMEKF